MKTKPLSKKLQFKKETVSNLNSSNMNRILGGVEWTVSCGCFDSFDSWCTCFGTCDTNPLVCTKPEYCNPTHYFNCPATYECTENVNCTQYACGAA